MSRKEALERELQRRAAVERYMDELRDFTSTNEKVQAEAAVALEVLGRLNGKNAPNMKETESRARAAGADVAALLAAGFAFDGGTRHIAPNHAKAVEFFKMAADKGSSFACVQLGAKQLQGPAPTGAEPREGLRWYLRGAELGNAIAQHRVACLFEEGLGCQPNKRRAECFFKMAADQGYKYSAHNMGVIYDSGRDDVEPNQELAVKYFTIAAEKRYAPSLARLGQMHLTGEGVEKDVVKARQYLVGAAEQGDVESQRMLGMLAAIPVPGLVGTETPLLDLAEAEKWLARAAAAGDAESRNMLTILLAQKRRARQGGVGLKPSRSPLALTTLEPVSESGGALVNGGGEVAENALESAAGDAEPDAQRGGVSPGPSLTTLQDGTGSDLEDAVAVDSKVTKTCSTDVLQDPSPDIDADVQVGATTGTVASS